MRFDVVEKIFSILSRPRLTFIVGSKFFRIKKALIFAPLKDVISQAQGQGQSQMMEKDWNYADWLLRVLSRKIASPSPCLCHALSLFSLSPSEASLLLYAKKEVTTLDGHAAVHFRGQIFSIASGWHSEEPFTEFRKKNYAG